MIGDRHNPDNFKPRERKNKGDKSLLDSTKYLSKEPFMPGMKKPLRPVPVFKQREGEHKRALYFRMNQTIQSLKQQRSYENEFNVQLQRDQQGNTKMVDTELDEVDQIAFDQKKAKLAKKGIVLKSKEEKRVARRAREKARKNKKKGGQPSEDIVDFADFKDSVEFGEVVHQPPDISFNHKRLDEDRPGRKNLLLKQKLGGGAVKKSKKDKPSMARQVVIDAERQRVVEAYRALKAQKNAVL